MDRTIITELIILDFELVDVLNQQSCTSFTGIIVREGIVFDQCAICQYLVRYSVIY